MPMRVAAEEDISVSDSLIHESFWHPTYAYGSCGSSMQQSLWLPKTSVFLTLWYMSPSDTLDMSMRVAGGEYIRIFDTLIHEFSHTLQVPVGVAAFWSFGASGPLSAQGVRMYLYITCMIPYVVCIRLSDILHTPVAALRAGLRGRIPGVRIHIYIHIYYTYTIRGGCD